MDATFANIFSKQPDEIINDDYFYRTLRDEGEYGQDVSWAKYKGITVEELHLEREKLWFEHEIIYNNVKFTLPGSFKFHWDMRTFESKVDPNNKPPWLINLYKSNRFSKINDILTKIAAEGKPFMDISSCEGMGLASFIIKKNPKMPCLVTDFHAHLLKNLRLFVNRELTEYNINIASFDYAY